MLPMLKPLFFLLLLGVTSYTNASIFTDLPLKPWQSQVPNSLSPVGNAQIEFINLLDNGVITYPQPQKSIAINLVNKNKTQLIKKSATFLSSAVIINASPAKVKQTLVNYKNYPKIFPKLVSAKILKQKNNLARVKYRAVIDIPVPILKFDEEFVFKHQIKGNTLSTWIEDSPVRYGMGQFQWYRIASGKYAGKTLLTLTQWGDLDNLNGFLLPRIVKAMPELKVSIPNGVNAYVLEALRLHFNGPDKTPNYTQAQLLPKWQTKVNQHPKIINKLLKNTTNFAITYAHPPRRLKNQTILRFVSSLQTMPAPQANVAKLLLNPKKYPTLFRQVKKVTVKPYTHHAKKGDLVTTDIKVGLGVISIPFQTKLFHHQPSVNSMQISAVSGDVKWVEGQFNILQKTKKSSVLSTSISSKTDKSAPFLLRIGHALPYHDYLGSVGVAPLLGYKIKKKL